MAIIVKDHDKLHSAVARTVLAGGAAAVVGLFLPAYLGAAVMALTLGVAVAPPKTMASGAWALLWACFAGAAAKVGGVSGALTGALALGGSLARGVDNSRGRLIAAAMGAIGAATGSLVQHAFGLSGLLGFLPNGIEAMIAGASAGFVVGVSSIGRHVALAPKPQEWELADVGDGELGELMGRAREAYREAVAALGDGAPEARAAAEDLMKKMAGFGQRWRQVEAEAGRTKPEEVRARLEKIEQKLLSAPDPVVRVELERAREALAAQLSYLDEIARGRDRAYARLTHQVATLERLRLAAVRHRSVDAARLGAELAPVVEELSQAGGDLDLASEALSEAVVTSAALPPASVN